MDIKMLACAIAMANNHPDPESWAKSVIEACKTIQQNSTAVVEEAPKEAEV